MSICPKCKEHIDFLHIKRAIIESGTFNVNDYGANYDWNDPEDNDDCNYYCPECEVILFNHEEDAEKFLSN